MDILLLSHIFSCSIRFVANLISVQIQLHRSILPDNLWEMTYEYGRTDYWWGISGRNRNRWHRIKLLPAVSGSVLCPKDAYIRMEQGSPTRYPSQPLLVFSDGTHISAPYLRRVWRAALLAIGVPNYEWYTLHGIRWGAATHVITSDPTARDDIKRHGFWASEAVDNYLPSTSSKVYNTMKKL